jgi:hypothetical protein
MKKNKNIFLPNSKSFFILRSPRTTGKNRTSPNNGPIKIFKEIIQILKSKPKKSQSCVPLTFLVNVTYHISNIECQKKSFKFS